MLYAVYEKGSEFYIELQDRVSCDPKSGLNGYDNYNSLMQSLLECSEKVN